MDPLNVPTKEDIDLLIHNFPISFEEVSGELVLTIERTVSILLKTREDPNDKESLESRLADWENTLSYICKKFSGYLPYVNKVRDCIAKAWPDHETRKGVVYTLFRVWKLYISPPLLTWPP